MTMARSANIIAVGEKELCMMCNNLARRDRQPEGRGWIETCCRRFFGLLAVCLVGAAVLSATAHAAPDVQFDRTRIVVKLAPVSSTPGNSGAVAAPQKITAGQSGRADFDRIVTEHSVNSVKRVFASHQAGHRFGDIALRMRLADYVVVHVPGNVDAERLLTRLENSNDVESAEFDVIVRIAGSITPDDVYFATHQYALANDGTQPPYDPGTAGADLEMTEAWVHTTGDSAIVLAILDTGVDFIHPDFAGRLWDKIMEIDDEIDNDSNGFIDDRYGWNFNGDNNWPNDSHSHGSHVAGIAAATGANGTGIAGMDWNCTILPVKVLGSDGSGTSSGVAAGIQYAVDEGAHVISMSLGAYAPSGVQEVAIDYAYAANVFVVAAMGNDNSSDLHWPAAFENVFAVAATDSDDRRALPFCWDSVNSGSNYGSYIEVCAPGENIWSTIPGFLITSCQGGVTDYGTKSGTSMATPHVAGLATLILSLRPDYPVDSLRRLIRISAEDEVGRPAEDLPGFDIYHGWGRINGRIALQALAVDMPPILTVPGPQAMAEADSLTFEISAVDSNFTTPALSVLPLANAVLTDHGDGTATFVFAPDYSQAGTVEIVFVASDGVLTDTDTVTVEVSQTCLCLCQGDPQCDSLTNVFDIVFAVEVAFREGEPHVEDACYPHPGGRTDVNCDDATNVFDVVLMVDVAFRDQPANFCAPCSL